MASYLGGKRYDPHLGATAYRDFGELSYSNIRYLANKPSDRARRQTLTAWYGFHGGKYAFSEYRKLKSRTVGNAFVQTEDEKP